ncbi:MAG: methyltransferase domain-containing protein [Phycisphaerae bacterium]
MVNGEGDRTGVLDVRPEAAFVALHRRGAVNIPLETLVGRIHELPPRDRSLLVYDAHPTRARWAVSRLRARGRWRIDVASGADWLEEGPVESGPSRDRLWKPHDLLVEGLEWCRREWGSLEGRTALDIACGSGRDAVFMGRAGLAVEAWDVLPDAVRLCEALAGRNGVSIRAGCRDVERDVAIEPLRYDLITCFNFLHRPLMPMIASAVRQGGIVIYETFVEPQRKLFGKPRRDAHLLRTGELPEYFDGWRVLVSREVLAGPRRFVASLIAMKGEGLRIANGE